MIERSFSSCPGPGMPIVGMVGAGQLARMTHQAAIGLGVGFRVMAATAADSAALVCGDVRLGDHRALEDLRTFAKGPDVLTFDHEHVPTEHLRALEAEGVAVRPGADALVHAQDKRAMRDRLAGLRIPMPRERPVDSVVSVSALAEETGWPVVLKAVRGGYDGRGVWTASSVEHARAVLDGVGGTPLMAEEFVEFRRELAVLVARSPHRQAVSYPVVETVQRDGICTEVIAPAPYTTEDVAVAAQRLALDIAEALGVVGLLAVEMFETDAGVLVNELAMRPHNCGHWTIEGSRTSQFEQHLRAVLDLPLGSPRRSAPYVVMANVLGGATESAASLYARYSHIMAHDPAVKVHFYGKRVRPGRKIGHVTALGDDLAEVRGRAREAADHLREADVP